MLLENIEKKTTSIILNIKCTIEGGSMVLYEVALSCNTCIILLSRNIGRKMDHFNSSIRQ